MKNDLFTIRPDYVAYIFCMEVIPKQRLHAVLKDY